MKNSQITNDIGILKKIIKKKTIKNDLKNNEFDRYIIYDRIL